jgi:twitching motility protein PilT
MAPRTSTSDRETRPYSVQGVARFRVNIYRRRGSLACILRIIPDEIPNIDTLGLPQVLKKIASNDRGLVLVTGATGSGKSSTLAAMIDHINRNESLHILTIEDPIEFVYKNIKSSISQREIGPDTESFARALRSALRQDPDVILVGEMRDTETIDIALKASETGHLVLSTVHTTDASRTINRLAVEQYIREDRASELKDVIEKGRDMFGMQSFDQHLTQLYREGIITLETAQGAATNPADFQRALEFD